VVLTLLSGVVAKVMSAAGYGSKATH